MIESKITHGNVLELERARICVLESINETGTEQTGIINTFGRTLAEPIMRGAIRSVCDIALTDGYAAHSSDTIGASDKHPCSLGILAESISPEKVLEPGTAIVVHTGDCLPTGADTVVPSEKTYRPDGGPEVLILAEVKPACNVQSTQAHDQQDTVMITKGTVIGPGEMSLLAHLGKPGICVRRKPRVAIITTGADVVEIVEKIKPGMTRNKARYEIVGMIMEAGCDLGRLIHVRDGRIGIEKAISESLDSEIIVVSLGDKDKHEIAVNALANLGDVRFAGIHISPGLATAFGMVEGRPVFITSGSYALESFEALVRPALQKSLGRAEIDRRIVSATLGEPLRLVPGSTHYIRSNTIYKNGCYETHPITSGRVQQNNCINSIAIATPEISSLKRGDKVNIIML
ncbi:MAG: molybdopterin molybdotransferase MoeA [Armatimonadota bacterium]